MSHRFIFLVLVYLDFSVSPGSAANQKRVPANPPANRSRDTLSHPRFSRIGFIFDKCINVFLSYYTLSLPFFLHRPQNSGKQKGRNAKKT